MRSAIMVTARMKSTRLPLKVTKDIQGKPMIVHMLDRLKLAKRPELIVICTSTNPQDDILAEIAKEQGVACYRGSEEDVLSRVTEAARKYKADIVVSCTADNPFVDPVYVDKVIDFHVKKKNDFTKINGLPFGAFSYAVSAIGMEKVCELKDENDTEVWGTYFTETGLFKCGALEVEEEYLRRPELRLTVDTPDDFRLVTEIFKLLYKPGRIFPLKDIIRVIDENPYLQTINSHIEQKRGIPIKLK